MEKPSGQISIHDIIQFRVELDAVDYKTDDLCQALKIFDTVIMNFALSLAPKETLQ